MYIESTGACNELISCCVSSSPLIYCYRLTLRESYMLSESVIGDQPRSCFSFIAIKDRTVKVLQHSTFCTVSPPVNTQLHANNVLYCSPPLT